MRNINKRITEETQNATKFLISGQTRVTCCDCLL